MSATQKSLTSITHHHEGFQRIALPGEKHTYCSLLLLGLQDAMSS